MDIQLYLKFFIGLFALVNPIGILPVYISMTDGQDKIQKQKTNHMANISVAIILIISLLIGNSILYFLDISINSFRIAGGILVIFIAMSMINGKLGEHKQTKQELTESIIRENIAVVPLALPLMAGPGAISSMIVWSSRYPDWFHTLGFILAIIIFSGCCWLLFKSAPLIIRVFRQTGINVVTRIMGLLLMALGVEFVITGLRGVFPGWL
ncbi:YchE family NAAT transporter [Utexia brackfieldae]|uniref:YchE family NAAT transporter n=1 Tax=Utexia brackfieldae TaxID=3074108 RepID=UPI00370D1A4F